MAPRRSSVAPQTRLVKDSHLTQSYSFGSGGVSTSSSPQHYQHGSSKAIRQPRAAPPVLPASPPRIPLVPNHARSHINVAAPPPSQMPASFSRRNSRVQVQMENQSTFATVIKDGGFPSQRRGSNASAGRGGGAHESCARQAHGWQSSTAATPAAGDSDGSRSGGWRKKRGGTGSRKKKSGSGAGLIA